MHPAAPPSPLPFTVRADRVGAIRRRRIAYPFLIVAAVAGGGALGILYASLAAGDTRHAWRYAAVLLVALVIGAVTLPRARRPPSADWLFRLEPDGLRLPPGGRGAVQDHPGLLLPWPLLTSLTPRRLGGEPTVVVGVRPEAEGVLLAQGCPPPQARMAVRKGFRLRLTGGECDPARCLWLLESTRAERMAAR